MKALRLILVSFLMLGLIIGEGALLLLYLGAGITDGFSYYLQHFAWVYYSMAWGIFLLPVIVFGSISFQFTCEKRFPCLTLFSLIAPFFVIAYCIWVFIYAWQHDTRGEWKPFKPLTSDYVCTDNMAVRVIGNDYTLYHYNHQMTESTSVKNYNELKKELGPIFPQCKNSKGEHVPRVHSKHE